MRYQDIGTGTTTNVEAYRVEDPQRLEERRAACGLEPHAEFERRTRDRALNAAHS
ncbi:hypothetical protein JK359_16025 [Streptomyces actinomycinicus]|uniref:Uncharacterized protein n=1 Tax=Streptomyces actinomycinicus TaxID=1695166 RepID=A0A937EHZ9_9ACTN|nr:hypothetical protein [Streptomyces actinomycinicus]MBL1083463.1 hypothetical protein [Streptomyces actinomycinicus]